MFFLLGCFLLILIKFGLVVLEKLKDSGKELIDRGWLEKFI